MKTVGTTRYPDAPGNRNSRSVPRKDVFVADGGCYTLMHRDGADSLSIAAYVTDLIFASKITAVATHVGANVRVVRSLEAMRDATDGAVGVIIDLNAQAGFACAELVRELKQRHPATPIVCFAAHVQTELIQAAREAGGDQVLARQAFTAKLPAILQSLASGRTLHGSPASQTPSSETDETTQPRS